MIPRKEVEFFIYIRLKRINKVGTRCKRAPAGVEVESDAKGGNMKHFASKINLESVQNSGAECLDEVSDECKKP